MNRRQAKNGQSFDSTTARTSNDGQDACAAVVVTYEPDLAVFEEQVRALSEQLAAVVIVDNGSGPEFQEKLTAMAHSNRCLVAVLLEKNYGIAYAQNRGIDIVIRLGKKYVLFLDHDSVPTPKMVSALYEAAEELEKKGVRIGAVGAKLVDPRSGEENGFYSMCGWQWRRLYCRNRTTAWVPCDYLNASGSLHPVDAILEVGKFDERFFIDHVDSDWFMRARASGFAVYGVCSALLHHMMGDKVIRFWLLGWRHMPHRSPERHYYIVRNALWLYRKKYAPFFWKANNVAKLAFTLVYFSLFDRQRKRQSRMILKGIKDGISNRVPR